MGLCNTMGDRKVGGSTAHKVMATERTNDEWRHAIHARDQDAWADLMQHLKQWVYTYCVKRLSWMTCVQRREFVQTSIQEVGLRIVRESHQYRGEGAFLGWCRTLALHVVLDRIRVEIRERQSAPVNLEGDIQGATTELDDVEREQVLDEIYQCIDAAVATELSDNERAVFRAGEEASVRQLASELGTSPNNIYQLRKRARRKIAQYLIDKGYTLQKLQMWGLL